MKSYNAYLASIVCLFCALTFGCGESTDNGTGTDPETNTENTFPSRTFTDGLIEGCEGNNISYHKWTDDDEAYATLIFSTGRSEYTDKYHHLIPLIDRHINIVFYDHIGQGRSDGTRAHLNNVDTEFACDLQQVVHQLTDPSLPRFILAHSMGSLAVIRALQLEPDLADAAAFSSPMWGLVFPGGVDVETARLLATDQVEQGNSEVPIAEPGPVDNCEDAKITHDCELYDQFSNDPLTLIGSATWGAGLAFINGIDAMKASLGDITVPFFIQSAGDEYWVDPTSHAAVCDGINAIHPEQCSLVVHDGEWHELLNEIDRAAYMESYLEFFDAQLAQ